MSRQYNLSNAVVANYVTPKQLADVEADLYRQMIAQTNLINGVTATHNSQTTTINATLDLVDRSTKIAVSTSKQVERLIERQRHLEQQVIALCLFLIALALLVVLT